jgi:putative spermidine/putrescine transport system permease protein
MDVEPIRARRDDQWWEGSIGAMATETQPFDAEARALAQDITSGPSTPAGPSRNWGKIIGAILFYGGIGFFLINLVGLVGSVVISSFGDHWFDSWLPQGGYSFQWYQFAASHHDLGPILFNTLVVAVLTTALALLIAFPAAYVLARNQFRGKGVLTALYLIPMLVPPLAYGIPLATVLLSTQVKIQQFVQAWLPFLQPVVQSTLPLIIVINLVPILPFVILILQPFIEQIDPSLENASKMLGGNQVQTFIRVLLPLIVPGLLTAGVLAVVRTVAMFDLTYLVADASSQTLVLSLFGDASASGITPTQAINALSVVYMLTTMSLLVIALIFVKPTQFVARVKTNTSR